jgi:hypothetical protein
MIQYQVALDPQLGLSAAEFVEAWNASPHAENAPAAVAPATRGAFLSPDMTLVLIGAAASIPAAVVAGFVTEYLKKKFLDKDAPAVTVTVGSTGDGQPIWIIRQTQK